MLSSNLVWLFYSGGMKDREVEGQAAFLPGEFVKFLSTTYF